MQLLNFENFVNEKYSSQLNESKTTAVKNFFKNILNKIKDWFTGKGAWMKNLQKLKDEVGEDCYKKVGIDFYDYSTEVVKESVKINEAETKNKQSGVALEHPDPEVPNFSFEEIEDALELHWKTKKPPFIWGAPGIGKTDVVKALAKKHGVPLILINLSMRDPVDFIGLPSIEKNRTVYNLPKFFPDDNGDGDKGGIIFFDELNRANGPVLSASLQLLLDRKIDEYQLPDKWLIVAAGNRSIEAPEVQDLGPALSNRVKHYNLVPDVKSWVKWADKQVDKDSGKGLLDANFIGFLLSKPEYFHAYAGKPNVPWPSPRSWAEAAKEYKLLLETNPKKANDRDYIKRKIAADVGTIAAEEFLNFLQLAKQFTEKDIDDVYAGKSKKYPPKNSNNDYKADVAFAILCAIVYSRRNQKIDSKEFINLVNWAQGLGNFELSSMFIKIIRKEFPDALKDKEVIKKLEDWTDTYEKDMKKMG